MSKLKMSWNIKQIEKVIKARDSQRERKTEERGMHILCCFQVANLC